MTTYRNRDGREIEVPTRPDGTEAVRGERVGRVLVKAIGAVLVLAVVAAIVGGIVASRKSPVTAYVDAHPEIVSAVCDDLRYLEARTDEHNAHLVAEQDLFGPRYGPDWVSPVSGATVDQVFYALASRC